MAELVLSLIPDDRGLDGPFACRIDVSGVAGDLNDVAILMGNFLRTFAQEVDEVRVYPKGSGVYFSSKEIGIQGTKAQTETPEVVH